MRTPSFPSFYFISITLLPFRATISGGWCRGVLSLLRPQSPENSQPSNIALEGRVHVSFFFFCDDHFIAWHSSLAVFDLDERDTVAVAVLVMLLVHLALSVVVN